MRVQGTSSDESMLVTDMEYADDANLCASNPQQLQMLIDCFVAYCDAHGLQVNPKKCEVVVFAKTSRAWKGSSWEIKGRQLPRSQKFKYLGVELHGTAGIKGCIPHRLSCMIAAQSAISRTVRLRNYAPAWARTAPCCHQLPHHPARPLAVAVLIAFQTT